MYCVRGRVSYPGYVVYSIYDTGHVLRVNNTPALSEGVNNVHVVKCNNCALRVNTQALRDTTAMG